MPKLSLSVRISAYSICALSFFHVLFWAYLAHSIEGSFLPGFPNFAVAPMLWVFSLVGFIGIAIGVAILSRKSWARVAALVLAALVACFCAFGGLLLTPIALRIIGGGFGMAESSEDRNAYAGLALIYFAILALACWWIYALSRRDAAAQFAQSDSPAANLAAKRLACPPPIALLAWLMVASALLSGASWRLILGKIPAMLFNHIFSNGPSKWIWIVNIVLFLVCGIGLLRLQRWSYTGAIALHVFWLISIFVTQMSANYETYTRTCVDALNLGEAYPVLNRLHFSPWIAATFTALPTSLLIAGIFYYRRSFLQAVRDSHRSPA